MIDLCVVNYNALGKMRRMISTLNSDKGYADWTLRIADNASTDGSIVWLMNNMGRYNIDSVFFNANIGYSAACNALAAEGEGDIIALLNSDVWFTSADLYRIAEAFNDDPDCAILGPKQRDELGRITHAGILGTNEKPKHRGWHESDKSDTVYRDKVEAVTVSGSAYFIRRSVWQELTECEQYRALFPDAQGAFLPTPHYYEETFCSYHATAHGYKVFYDGRISIGHSWHSSSPIGGAADKMFHTSRDIFRNACDFHQISHD